MNSSHRVRQLLVILSKFVRESTAIFAVEGIKLFREPTEIISRAVQPLLWLLVFGQVMAHTRGIPTGNMHYLAFLTPGILAQSVLFASIFYGIAVIWERDLGVVHKMLVSPAYRGSLVFGKALSAGLRGLVQAAIVYLLAIIMRIKLQTAVWPVTMVLLTVVLGSSLFSTFSLIIACLVKTRERFMGIGQVLTMPLFFASNAIYPLELMPEWLQTLARWNPLTYLVDLLRTFMIVGGVSSFGVVFDSLLLLSAFLGLLLIAAKIYVHLLR